MFKSIAVNPPFLRPSRRYVYSTVKLKSNGYIASPCSRPMKKGKLSNICLSVLYCWFLLNTIFAITSFAGITTSLRILYETPSKISCTLPSGLYLITALLYSCLCQAFDEYRVYFLSLHQIVKSFKIFEA